MTGTQIDRAVFDELRDSTGADFVTELVAAFLDEAPAMLDDMKRAAGAGDADGFRRAAHSIKSNANIFGAQLLAEQARTLEHAGLPPDVDQAQAGIAALEQALAQATSALKEISDG